MPDFGKIISELMINVACAVFGSLLSVWPSTPPEYTLAGLADSMANVIPFVGSGIVFSFLRSLSVILGLISIIKIYQLIPFKFS